MAETTLDLRTVPRGQAYGQLLPHVELVLEGIDDPIAAMATMSCLVHHAFGHLWTGFYRVVTAEGGGGLLRVGPYQGTLGCLEIAFGRGVCGMAAAERRTVVVEDVHAFPGHITCDGRSRSEIVVPVFDAEGALVAVLDIDSDRPGAFGDEDRLALEHMVSWFARVPASPTLPAATAAMSGTAR
jgi:GAF domain-containing protein